MRVLLLTGDDQKYGTFQMTLNLIRGLKEIHSDVEYIVVTQSYGMINEVCEHMNVENHVIPYKYCVYAPCKNQFRNIFKKNIKRVLVSINMRLAWRRVASCMDKSRIDIIHTNNNRDLFGAFLTTKLKKPHVVHIREFTKVDFSLDLLFSRQIPYLNMHTNAYVAVSDAVKDYWIRQGIDAKRIQTIYDGIDPLSVPYQTTEKNNDRIRIVMCGQLTREKGQLQLIQAINLLKDEFNNQILVDFYGDDPRNGSYLKELNQFVQENGLDKIIRFLGYKKNVSKDLYQYDIGVVCSRSEGFGLVTLEYMLAGICPIVSDTGANKELIVNKETGLVYLYGNIQDLANKIKSVVNEKEFRKTLSKNARERAETFFSLEQCAKKMYKLYSKALGERQQTRNM